jgi:GGDEF domain-containing protein/ABC-type uncharacterized transport system substrate-binding protein
MGRHIRILSFLLLACLSINGHCEATRILILNSYHPQYTWTAKNTRGILDTLLTKVDDENVHIEYMDSRRFTEDDTYLKKLITLYSYKYKTFKPQLIISTDDFALDFLLANRDRIFGQVPVIFNGVNFDVSEKLKGQVNYTGIMEGDAVVKNLDLIQAIHGDSLKEILVLGDKSKLSRQFINKVQQYKEAQSQSTPEIKIVDDFSFKKLLFDIHNNAKDSAIFVTAIHKDKEERYFSYESDIPDLANYSPVPIYGMWGTPLLGLGVVGGYMNNPYLHGKNTAEIALKVIAGTAVEELPQIRYAEYRPKFDANKLEQFSIAEDQLPADSEILFRKTSFLQEYRNYFLTALAILLALILTIAFLLAQARKRKKVEEQLAQLNRELEKKVELRTQSLEQSNQSLTQLTQRMEALANTDDLTMIPNRRHGKRVLDRLEYDADKEDFTLALIDIDHFKQINDQHGHDAGDSVLHQLCRAIESMIRPADTLCRWGGEEFLLILPGCTLVIPPFLTDAKSRGYAAISGGRPPFAL